MHVDLDVACKTKSVRKAMQICQTVNLRAGPIAIEVNFKISTSFLRSEKSMATHIDQVVYVPE